MRALPWMWRKPWWAVEPAAVPGAQGIATVRGVIGETQLVTHVDHGDAAGAEDQGMEQQDAANGAVDR